MNETIKYTGNKPQVRNYCIKADYTPNLKPSYYLSQPEEGLIWQGDVYKLAAYIAEKAQAEYIIDAGSGDGSKLQKFQEKYKIIAVDYGANKELIHKNLTTFKFVDANLEDGFPEIDGNVLKRSVIIMADVIEHIIYPDKLLYNISDIAKQALSVIISTPDRDLARGTDHTGPSPNPCHVREWNKAEFKCLLELFGIQALYAHSRTHDKTNEFNTLAAIIFGSNTGKIIPEDSVCSLILYPHMDFEDKIKTHQVLELAKQQELLKKQIVELTDQNNILSKQIIDIYKSKSWRIGHKIIRMFRFIAPKNKG